MKTLSIECRIASALMYHGVSKREARDIGRASSNMIIERISREEYNNDVATAVYEHVVGMIIIAIPMLMREDISNLSGDRVDVFRRTAMVGVTSRALSAVCAAMA